MRKKARKDSAQRVQVPEHTQKRQRKPSLLALLSRELKIPALRGFVVATNEIGGGYEPIQLIVKDAISLWSGSA